MISPMAKGLFHRAIAESGGPIIGSEYLSPNFNGNMVNVSKMGQKLTSKHGCDKAEDVLAVMRAKSAREWTAMARKLKVHHGAELAYVFGNMDKSDGYNDTDRVLSNQMMNYWVNFARTGNPNGEEIAYRPAYKGKSDLNIEFSDTIHTNKHLFKKECDFISRMMH